MVIPSNLKIYNDREPIFLYLIVMTFKEKSSRSSFQAEFLRTSFGFVWHDVVSISSPYVCLVTS